MHVGTRCLMCAVIMTEKNTNRQVSRDKTMRNISDAYKNFIIENPQCHKWPEELKLPDIIAAAHLDNMVICGSKCHLKLLNISKKRGAIENDNLHIVKKTKLSNEPPPQSENEEATGVSETVQRGNRQIVCG
jgi:hypothetical protein